MLQPPPLIPSPQAELEEQECALADELAVSFVPYADEAEAEAVVTSWKLSRVPDALAKELDSYLAYRTSPLNRERDGSCCVDITVGNDRRTTLAFLGWLHAERSITAGLGVFCRAALSQWVEDWLKALSEKGLKYSSLANYTNSLCMVCSFVYQTYSVDADALALPTSPLDEMLRMRAQCEGQAKHAQLYDRRDPNWLDWSECQEARTKAEAAYKALPKGSTPYAKKMLALREWCLIALHTCMPPDRVGIVRKLRFNMTLKRTEEGGFELDMTSARSHKTSRFYGPSINTLSSMLNEPLSLYLSMLELDAHGNESPYLFYPTQSGDTTRCLPSSQWSQLVSRTLKKHAGKAAPPKLLRAAFVTWLRDSTDAPEVLKAAAKAMRHKEETQQSDRYDKVRATPSPPQRRPRRAADAPAPRPPRAGYARSPDGRRGAVQREVRAPLWRQPGHGPRRVGADERRRRVQARAARAAARQERAVATLPHFRAVRHGHGCAPAARRERALQQRARRRRAAGVRAARV